VTLYGSTPFHSNRFAIARPIVTAGLKCPPETCPKAYAPASTDRPKANETPTNPIPSCTLSSVRNFAARIAAPHPPNSSTNVPRNSAPSFAANDGSRMWFSLPPEWT